MEAVEPASPVPVEVLTPPMGLPAELNQVLPDSNAEPAKRGVFERFWLSFAYHIGR